MERTGLDVSNLWLAVEKDGVGVQDEAGAASEWAAVAAGRPCMGSIELYFSVCLKFSVIGFQ